MDTKTISSILLFLVLTFAGSSYFYVQSIDGAGLAQIALSLMWMPGLAAIITQLVFQRSLRGMGWGLGSLAYLALAVAIPLTYCVLIYVPVWLTGLGGMNISESGAGLVLLPVSIMLGVLTALGEEIGWRGFLTPALDRVGGFPMASLLTGFIWGIWHLPILLGADYNAGTPAWYGATCFMISVLGMSVMLAWLRLRTASLWPAVLFHATHNAAIQGVFDKGTVKTGPTVWITTEFGAGLAIASLVLGAYFWRRQAELPRPEGQPRLAL